MDNKQFDTPILMIVWARPDATKQVFAQIKQVKPRQLFVAGDAGRNPEEQARCDKAREILKEVNWPCEIKTLYQEKNLGCKYGMATAIHWFFDNVEEGIILEDDCVPDQSFFYFCQELLEKYRYDTRVMSISGDNFQQHNPYFKCDDSYYFSRVMHEWGWASWRRAWSKYDITMSQWPIIKRTGGLYSIFKDPAIAYRWGHLFEQHYNPQYEKKMNAWDGQWAFACMINGVCINPRTNLVTNIGFNNYARRTYDPHDEIANLPAIPISIPLQHPAHIIVNEQADAYTHKYVFNINRYLGQRIKWFLKSRFIKPYLSLKKIYCKVTQKTFNDQEIELIK